MRFKVQMGYRVHPDLWSRYKSRIAELRTRLTARGHVDDLSESGTIEMFFAHLSRLPPDEAADLIRAMRDSYIQWRFAPEEKP